MTTFYKRLSSNIKKISEEIKCSETNQLVKKVDKQYAQLGETLTYTILFINSGNRDMINVVLTDELSSNLQFVHGSVTVNGVKTFHELPSQGIRIDKVERNHSVVVGYKVIVEKIPLNCLIENCAKLKYEILEENYGKIIKKEIKSNKIITFVRSVDFSGENFKGSVDCDFAIIGDIITYTFNIKNNGNINAENVVFKDDFDNNLFFIENSVEVNGIRALRVDPQKGICFGNMDVGSNYKITFQVRVEKVPKCKFIYNKATLEYCAATNPNKSLVRKTRESNVVKVLLSSAQILVKKSVYPKVVFVEDNVTYTIKLFNKGNQTAENIKLIDTLVPELEFLKYSVAINGNKVLYENPLVGIKVGNLKPDEMVTITFQAKVKERTISGQITNMAEVIFIITIEEYNICRMTKDESEMVVLFIE